MNNAIHELDRYIDDLLPASAVLRQAAAFLAECRRRLEIGEEVVEVPEDAELAVRSRAFIKADLDDVFLGDHLEAVVLLGREEIGDNARAKYAVLRMYFDLAGRFVSEDRCDRFK